MDLVYHASPVKGIALFEPRAESVRDKHEGPVVFATPDKAYASMFIVQADDSWTKRGRFGKDEPWFMVISDEQRYRQADKGGSIYAFDASVFQSDTTKHNADLELVSKVAVEPVGEEQVESGLAAMQALGVEIHFVDPETFQTIKNSPDHGRSILGL